MEANRIYFIWRFKNPWSRLGEVKEDLVSSWNLRQIPVHHHDFLLSSSFFLEIGVLSDSACLALKNTFDLLECWWLEFVSIMMMIEALYTFDWIPSFFSNACDWSNWLNSSWLFDHARVRQFGPPDRHFQWLWRRHSRFLRLWPTTPSPWKRTIDSG